MEAIEVLKSNDKVDKGVAISLEAFNNQFQLLKDHFSTSKMAKSDALVRAIVSLVNERYLKNKGKLLTSVIHGKLKWPFHAENHVINLVARRTACGTTAEATLVLLRDVGFRTRLMGISSSPKKVIFNHVFLEYYSIENEKWVMIDPMINIVLSEKTQALSTFEMLQRGDVRARLNKKWTESKESSEIDTARGFYTKDTISFFSNHFGPLLKTFYFVVNPMVRTKLEKRFSSKNYKPDWLK